MGFLPRKQQRTTYEQRANRLARTVDVAETVIRASRELSAREKREMLKFGEETKRFALEPEPRFRRVESLEYLESEFLTYWNESIGPDTETFWKLIKQAGIDFERRDVIQDVLRRGRIASIHEYDAIVDNIVIVEQEGIVSPAEVRELSRMLGEYESRNS